VLLQFSYKAVEAEGKDAEYYRGLSEKNVYIRFTDVETAENPDTAKVYQQDRGHGKSQQRQHGRS